MSTAAAIMLWLLKLRACALLSLLISQGRCEDFVAAGFKVSARTR